MTSSVASAKIFDLVELLGDKRQIKKNTIDVGENLLVISCVLYRLRKQDKSNIHYSLTDKFLINNISAVDRELAEKITKHFQQKLLILKLKNITFTPYRQDLFDFINNTNGNGYGYPENYLGLAYRLPYFYFYDIDIIDIFGKEFVEIKGDAKINGNLKLKFIKTLKTYKKYNNYIEYWFTDSNDNRVMLAIDINNVLMNLFDHRIRSAEVEVSGKFHERKKDNMSFLTPDSTKWNLVIDKVE